MGDIEVDRLKLKEGTRKKKDGEKVLKAAQKKLKEKTEIKINYHVRFGEQQ